MKIAFVINDIETEKANYTTVKLAQKAHNLGHDAYLMGVADLAYYPDGLMGGKAYKAPAGKYKTGEAYMKAMKTKEGVVEHLTAQDIDVLLLRNDPASEPENRSWARIAGVVFAQLAVQNGVIVLNDPNSLADAFNKMYFQHFPESVRPRTIISRNVKEIRSFFEEQNSNMILKPLQGSGGTGVFIVREDDATNLNQMVEAIGRDGFVIAQEYLTAASEGDVRLFVMNGHALQLNGKYAAFRRKNEGSDIRSNVSVGGKVHPVKVDETMLKIVETVRPKLIKDGMFLVGLDIVGDKLMEINVFSPGGLNVGGDLYGVDFAAVVIEAIERKVQYKKDYGDKIDNKTLASL
ncbi:MAG: glutathione synthetase [Bacteroidota bacterium]|nr:glutathione synthetase [Bacteroidota bacterium]